VDSNLYETEEAVAEIDTEEEYLCAFIAYQINKVENIGIPQYSDAAEATKRYPHFKKCVQDVTKFNSETDDTEFGVNFFCDMTQEERDPYASAHSDGDSDFGVGAGVGAGSGSVGDLGPPGGDGSDPGPPGGDEIPPNSVIIEILGDKFKMPESTVTDGVTADSLTLAECVDSNLYDTEEAVAEIDEEEEYLCAFVNFQIHKEENIGIPYYSDVAEATKRYPLFKKCVDYVKGLNKGTDNTEFGINFFCDMTSEEKNPFANSDYDHFGEFGIGSGYDGGASEKDAAVATKTSYVVFAATLAVALNIVHVF